MKEGRIAVGSSVWISTAPYFDEDGENEIDPPDAYERHTITGETSKSWIVSTFKVGARKSLRVSKTEITPFGPETNADNDCRVRFSPAGRIDQ